MKQHRQHLAACADYDVDTNRNVRVARKALHVP